MKIKYYSVVFFGFLIVFSFFFFIHHSIAKELQKEEEKQTNYIVHIDMPKVSNPKLMGIITKEMEKRKQEFIKEAKENFSENPYTLQIAFENVLFDSYDSYAFYIETYLGGTHPNTSMWTIVYDLKLDQVVTLENLIEKEPMFLERASKNVQASFLIDPGITNITWMMEGTKKRKENFQNFIFTENGILFYFLPYQIAPYSNGILVSSVEYDMR